MKGGKTLPVTDHIHGSGSKFTFTFQWVAVALLNQKRHSDISLAKVNYCEISRQLQLRVCHHGMHTRVHAHTQSLQLCPTLCDPVDCNTLGSSVHGIL